MDNNVNIPEGYESKGKIEINDENLSKFKVQQHPIGSGDLSRREDKSVTYQSEGKEISTSSIMLGYNKDKIQLPDGSYVSLEEFLSATEAALQSSGENTVIICTKTGKSVDPSKLTSLLKDAVKKSAKVNIGTADGRVVERTIVGENSSKQKNSPMIVSEKFKIGTGEYVSLLELQNALNDYILATPKVITPVQPQKNTPEQQSQEKKNIVVRISEKYSLNMKKILLCSLIVIPITLSGLNITNNTIQNIKYTKEQQIIEVVEYDANYKIIMNGKEYDISDNELNNYLNKYALDKEINLPDGLEFSEYGNGTGAKKNFDKFELEGKESGEYNITGFAIYDKDGNLVSYMEMFNGKDSKNTNLSKKTNALVKFIEQTLKENSSLTEDDLDIKIHFGDSVNKNRLGWISLDKLEKAIEKENSKLANDNKKEYKGIVNNFEGDYITIQTENGPVNIKITDENGNYLTPGRTVIGSDNQEYVVEYLTIEENVRQEMQEISAPTVTEQKNRVIKFNILPGIMAASVLAGLTALEAAKVKKLNEEAKKKIRFKELENTEEYQKFLKDFEEKKVKYEGKSKFAKFFIKKEELVQRYTSEQLIEIYDMITRRYGNNVTIKILNDKFQVIYPSGAKEDVDESILKDIREIGKDNPYEARTR